ncbi:MAG: type IV toxin-antitoxin system AbiEi family antitoxin [Rickettsiaceae bacterium]|nr:type IV toxin-antitoxin system AbiEi family antitoxin [Rickettsiaceae bacterium]
MTRIIHNKINRFITTLPQGRVLPSDWLVKQGISSKLAWWYIKSGWLERVGARAYKKIGEEITWPGVVATLQTLMQLPVHVGAKTALELLGRAHFIPMGELKQVILFAAQDMHTPSWLQNNKWDAHFEIYKTILFQKNNSDLDPSIIECAVEGISLQISCPERAAMEMLHLLPSNQTFDEAVLLMENLGQLRPSIVQLLLEHCNSIKVKRLFLCLAERSQHAWLSKLDLSKIDLGEGKRVIGAGGKYDSKYMLSLPQCPGEI